MLNAVVAEKRDLHPELMILKVKPDFEIPDFKPGQYVALGLPGTAPRHPAFLGTPAEGPATDKLIKRAYSIGSPASDKSGLEFYIAVLPHGPLSSRLAALQAGDRLFCANKIVGTFSLDGVPPEKYLLLVSTGTGVAPFVSMLRTESTWTPGRTITLLHGVRYSSDLGYDNVLREFERRYSQFRYLPIVSRESPEKWSGRTGRVQSLFDDRTVTLDPESDHVFLCGNPAMIEELESSCRAAGFRLHERKVPGNLHVEKYW